MKQLKFVMMLTLGNLLLVPGQVINLNKESAEKALTRHRHRIDDLDQQIVSLLNERARLALEIGRIRKREKTPPSSARGRQDEVLRNAMANSIAPLSPEAARHIYERIIAEMVAIQALDGASQGAGRTDRRQAR
jgi:chorismate mutase